MLSEGWLPSPFDHYADQRVNRHRYRPSHRPRHRPRHRHQQLRRSLLLPEPTEPPGLHDEGRLDEEQMFALEDFHGFGMPYDESLFDEKSDLWKKEWLTRR